MIVWRDLGVSKIMTDEMSPVKEFTMALGPDITMALGSDTGSGGPVSEKTRRTIAAMAAAGMRSLKRGA